MAGWVGAFGDRRKAVVIAALLDAAECPPAIAALGVAAGLQSDLFVPFGGRALPEKAAHAARIMGVASCHLETLVPPWFRDAAWRVTTKDDGREWAAMVEAMQLRPPTWLRIDPSTIGRVMEILAPFDARPNQLCRSAIRIPPGLALGRFPALASLVTVQDLASQVVGLVCDPVPGSRWWDACAGSGGKTLHLAALMHGRGDLVATDVRPSILNELERRIRAAGVRTVDIRIWSGAADDRPPGLFDGVLIDAPCSGTGTWHRNPDARWRTPAGVVAEKAAVQIALLETASVAVRPGGMLVYAVCSVTEAEGPGVARAFLARRPEWALAPFENPLKPGLPSDGTLRISPAEHACNGMFIARFRRSGA